MNRISNPYNIHALHSLYNPWDQGQYCPLYCSTKNLPATQIKLASSTSGSSFLAFLVNPDSGFSQTVTSHVSRTCTTAGVFFDYDGATLDTELDEGFYQLKLVVGSTEYWGYPYCAKGVYDSTFLHVPNISCSSSGAGSYTFTWADTPSNFQEEFGYLHQYNAGSGWITFGSASGTLTEADLGDSGTITANIRIKTFRGNTEGWAIYELSFNASNPCSYSTNLIAHGGESSDGFGYISWTNTNDLQNLGLRYAGGYAQRFYFEAHPGHPAAVLQDNFVQNGTNGLFLESGLIAEQVNVDFWPLPEHAATVLASIRLHDTINAVANWYQGTESGLTNFSFTPTPVEGSLCQQGRFSWERNRQYVGGCQEDFTTQSC